jgi:hypothetical protein
MLQKYIILVQADKQVMYQMGFHTEPESERQRGKIHGGGQEMLDINWSSILNQSQRDRGKIHGGRKEKLGAVG